MKWLRSEFLGKLATGSLVKLMISAWSGRHFRIVLSLEIVPFTKTNKKSKKSLMAKVDDQRCRLQVERVLGKQSTV